jgi:hypothetical protein
MNEYSIDNNQGNSENKVVFFFVILPTHLALGRSTFDSTEIFGAQPITN